MSIGLHHLIYDERTGAIVGSWTVHRRDELTMKSRHVDFVKGVAKGVHGRELRRIVCAMGPSLSHAFREDAPGCIGDAADDGLVGGSKTVAPAPVVDANDGLGGPAIAPDYVPPEPEPELADREPTVPTVVDPKVSVGRSRKRAMKGRKPTKK